MVKEVPAIFLDTLAKLKSGQIIVEDPQVMVLPFLYTLYDNKYAYISVTKSMFNELVDLNWIQRNYELGEKEQALFNSNTKYRTHEVIVYSISEAGKRAYEFFRPRMS